MKLKIIYSFLLVIALSLLVITACGTFKIGSSKKSEEIIVRGFKHQIDSLKDVLMWYQDGLRVRDIEADYWNRKYIDLNDSINNVNSDQKRAKDK